MVPADIDERRRQLFQPEGMVRLTEEEYDVYWPWVKWLWNQQAVKLKNKTRWYRCKFSDRRKTIRGRKKAPASNYYNCRCALKVVHKDWIGWEFSQTSTSLGHNHDIDSDPPPEVGTHVRLEVMDGRTPTTISNNITNTRTVVQRPLDNILPLGRIGINGSGEVACPLTKIFNCAETFPHPYPAMMHARIHIGGDVPCPWADELNCSRILEGLRMHSTMRSRTIDAQLSMPAVSLEPRSAQRRSSLFEKWSTIRERFTKAAHLALSAKNTSASKPLAISHLQLTTGGFTPAKGFPAPTLKKTAAQNYL
jgi:hypothetical protein